MTQHNMTIFPISLGCPKNRVDSEVMLGLLSEAGYTISDKPEAADILLVNTCGFIQPAVEEAIDTIMELIAVKERHPGSRLVVSGCLVQRYGQALARELPEVDIFIGTDTFRNIVTYLTDPASRAPRFHVAPPSYVMDSQTPRLLSTPGHRAYLKITEGCSNKCAYCMIPSIRGPLRSRTIADIVQEVKELDSQGITELTLVGQDLTAYGRDLQNGPALHQLLAQLLHHSAIPWLRLLYLYPGRLSNELLDIMAAEERLLNYLDIPLQHVAEGVLKRMRRPFGKRHLHALIERIRVKVPAAAIRTTFMVGFPGENDADVEEIADFLRNYRLHNVGVFTYSNEEGCAAEQLSDQIDEQVKRERADYLMGIQSQIAAEINQGYVGQELEVLVEGVSQETELLLEGRSRFQAPEIDGCVYIADGQCNSGDLVTVKITEAHPYDLVGRIVTRG